DRQQRAAVVVVHIGGDRGMDLVAGERRGRGGSAGIGEGHRIGGRIVAQRRGDLLLRGRLDGQRTGRGDIGVLDIGRGGGRRRRAQHVLRRNGIDRQREQI